MKKFEHPISIAPMMQRTDRHYRFMMRLISRRTLLYTEMVTANAILHGDRPYLLDFSQDEHPLVLQTGGDEPEMLAETARIAELWGYDEINLNVGCPSPRVQKGNFGACLMQTPTVVADAVRAMQAACDIEVTVKHRIGVDDQEDWASLRDFVAEVADAGCERFSVHARKAWLNGLSPKENREIPPLRYELVWKLKQEFPHLVVEINGGITTLEMVREHLEHVDAVMIGRAAYDNPMLFADFDAEFYGATAEPLGRDEVVVAMLPYIEEQVASGTRLPSIVKHMANLYAGQPGGRKWRRHLTEAGVKKGAGVEVVKQALEIVQNCREKVSASASAA